MTGIEMPMQLKDIPRFERQNDISVSVYGWELTMKNKDEEVEPGYAYTLRITEEIKPNHFNLLMIGDDVKHYCWIKKFFKVGQCAAHRCTWGACLLPHLPPWVLW